MNNETQVDTVETVKPQETQEEASTSSQVEQEAKKVKSSEVLRELAKEYGINLFEEGGLEVFKQKLSTKDVELNTLKEANIKYENDLKVLQTKEQEYQTKIEALGLGFKPDNLDEVIALAKVNLKDGQTLADGLKVVKEKYGAVFTLPDSIGTQKNDMKGEKPDGARTEQEKYLAANRKYQQWYGKK